MQVCHYVIRRPKAHVRKAPFAAVRNKHPRGYELPKEESTGPNETDSDDGVRCGRVARGSALHLKDVPSSNFEVREYIR